MIIKRNFDLLDRFAALPDTVGTFILSGKKNGKWREYNYQEYTDISLNVSMGLLALGFKPGDHIATITNNRPEWNFMEMGVAQAGMVHVPIHPTLSDDELVYVLNHSESKLIVVSDKSLYNKISSFKNRLKHARQILTFNEVDDADHWTLITDAGKKNSVEFFDKVQEIKESISEDNVFTIIYTSGTTGMPKGVMLTHKNLMSNALASAKVQHLNYHNKVLSFLPLSHVFEHMVNYKYHYLGVSIYYAENINTIANDIKELQVDGFITVPRLLESIYEKIIQKARKLGIIKRSIFLWALKLANKYTPYKKHSIFYRIKHKLADKLVFSKWRAALSPNITFIGCGGSALQERLTRIFWAAGLPVFEGYGLTETSPVVAVNYSKPGAVKAGAVGKVLNGVQVKIANDGEILVKGPNVMPGYYKDPEATKAVIDEEGWFHTGDIGNFDGKFLKITDRKKEMFKMSNGKYIAPQQIENKLKESFYIQQTMVVGENEKFPAAIISPNFQELKQWCEKMKIEFSDYSELVKKPMVLKHFDDEIKSFNKRLSENERIKRFIVIADEWSPLTGELSSSLKLKRKYIIQKYRDMVESIYHKAEPIVVKQGK